MRDRAPDKERNKALAWDAFRAGTARIGSMPFRASIEITRNCNFNCIMCSRASDGGGHAYDPSLDMTPRLFDRVAAQLFPYLTHAHLQGFGETVVSRHWPEILDKCAVLYGSVRFSLVTNLGVDDPAMWRKMTAAGFWINFSCDGVTKKTFEYIRRGSRFESILRNMEIIQAARREHGRGNLSLLVTLQKNNYMEMPGFVDLAKRYGAGRVTFTSVRTGRPGLLRKLGRVFPPEAVLRLNFRPALGLLGSALKAAVSAPGKRAHGGPAEDISLYGLPRQELLELRSETMARARAAGVQVLFNDSLFDGGGASVKAAVLPAGYEEGIEDSCRVSVYKKCFKPYHYAMVNYKGDLGLCNHLISDSKWKHMGNLERTPLSELWNSPAYIKARRRLAAGRPDNESCLWCFGHRLAA
jgi:radical SAM protein with 4Fe4S-binding SPASM domain